MTLPDFNWTNALLDPQSPYYNEVHDEIIKNVSIFFSSEIVDLALLTILKYLCHSISV